MVAAAQHLSSNSSHCQQQQQQQDQAGLAQAQWQGPGQAPAAAAVARPKAKAGTSASSRGQMKGAWAQADTRPWQSGYTPTSAALASRAQQLLDSQAAQQCTEQQQASLAAVYSLETAATQ
jgi:hypothetical protein